MISNTFTRIFKNGSKTYFYSSLFFPKEIRDDVFILYSFVRTADNFVDAIPQQKNEFRQFREKYIQTLNGTYNGDEIISAFVSLMKRQAFQPQWIDAFLNAMKQDLTKNKYNTIQETEEYMYGSAEVIGLCMASIMELPKESYASARKLGKAMQLINFIRDIEEDNQLGRTYLPLQEITAAGLTGITKSEALANPKGFELFITQQLSRYEAWQKEAENGFRFIPRRYRIPIKTASDMYKFTAYQIKRNPTVVFQKKVKPNMYRIIGTGLKNSFF